jgi:phospholipid-binding lipoprotein MlaA
MQKIFSTLLVFLLLNGCSSKNEPIDSEFKNHTLHSENDSDELPEPDELELFNRYMYGFNKIIDTVALKPAAIMYDQGVPDNAKYCIESFINNLSAPINCVNYVMQGNGEKTARTAFRFLLNSTFGLFGLIDFANFIGIEEEPTSFNETLASWGVESGSYIMLPIFGPTTFRGLFGHAFDWFLDPVRIVANHRNESFNNHKQFSKYMWYATALNAVAKRKELLVTLDDIDETSLDPYVTIRSVVFQRQLQVDKRLKARS